MIKEIENKNNLDGTIMRLMRTLTINAIAPTSRLIALPAQIITRAITGACKYAWFPDAHFYSHEKVLKETTQNFIEISQKISSRALTKEGTFKREKDQQYLYIDTIEILYAIKQIIETGEESDELDITQKLIFEATKKTCKIIAIITLKSAIDDLVKENRISFYQRDKALAEFVIKEIGGYQIDITPFVAQDGKNILQ